MVEHGHEQQDSVINLLMAEGYQNIAGIRDYTGHGRIVIGQYLPPLK